MTTPTEDNVWTALTSIFRDVFDDDGLIISSKTTAADIDEWDSLTNIQLLVAIEQKFGIRFTSAEVADIPDVGGLVRLIAEHSTTR